MTEVVKSKKPWFSKTVITNIIGLVISFVPSVGEILTPEMTMQLFLVVNIILRFVSKDKISLTE